jgi:hypothetical protein
MSFAGEHNFYDHTGNKCGWFRVYSAESGRLDSEGNVVQSKKEWFWIEIEVPGSDRAYQPVGPFLSAESAYLSAIGD